MYGTTDSQRGTNRPDTIGLVGGRLLRPLHHDQRYRRFDAVGPGIADDRAGLRQQYQSRRRTDRPRRQLNGRLSHLTAALPSEAGDGSHSDQYPDQFAPALRFLGFRENGCGCLHLFGQRRVSAVVSHQVFDKTGIQFSCARRSRR